MDVTDAITSGDSDLVEELFSRASSKVAINGQLQNGMTPLIFAIENKQYNVIGRLIALGADVNLIAGKTANYNQWLNDTAKGGINDVSPLQAAMDAKDVDIIMLLMSKGCRPTANKVSLHTLLHRAIKWNAVQLVRLIVTQVKEEDLYIVQSRFDLSQHLLTAVQDNSMLIVNVILEQGANPNHPHDNLVPIVVAANNGNMRMCQSLINHGAEINKQTAATLGQANTPLGMAICAEMNAAIKRLIMLGADVNSTIDWSMPTPDGNIAPGSSMLHIACIKRQKDVVELLLNHGACMFRKDTNGDTIFHVLVRDKSQESEGILCYLLEMNHNAKPMPYINVDTKNNVGYTALMMAAQSKNLAAVNLLLNFGADASMKSTKRHSALMFAVENCSKDIGSVLLNTGSDVNAMCAGLTPIHVSIRNGHYPLTDMLLKNGANIHALTQEGADLHTNRGATTAHLAVVSKSAQILQLVIDHSVDVNARTSSGDTALMLAARQHGKDLLEMLLNNGAAMNLRDRNQKETALSLSVYFGYDDNSELLISHGADVNMPDKRNAPPLYWAIFNCRIRTLQLLILADATFTTKTLYGFPKNLSVMRNKPLFAWLKAQTSCVPSLQRRVRAVVRHRMGECSKGKSIHGAIFKLPLPGKMHRYLALQDEELYAFDWDA